ncbi:MAG: cupin [Dehalococcoidia bacterium]
MQEPAAKPRPSTADVQPHGRRIEKPWGWEIIWAESEAYTGKLLHIAAGCRLSLQYHDQKLETQCLVSGRAVLVVEDRDGALCEIAMEIGKGYTVYPFQLHRLVAIEDAEIYEVSTPEAGTTVRVSDDYARPDETEATRALTDRGWSPLEAQSEQ